MRYEFASDYTRAYSEHQQFVYKDGPRTTAYNNNFGAGAVSNGRGNGGSPAMWNKQYGFRGGMWGNHWLDAAAAARLI